MLPVVFFDVSDEDAKGIWNASMLGISPFIAPGTCWERIARILYANNWLLARLMRMFRLGDTIYASISVGKEVVPDKCSISLTCRSHVFWVAIEKLLFSVIILSSMGVCMLLNPMRVPWMITVFLFCNIVCYLAMFSWDKICQVLQSSKTVQNIVPIVLNNHVCCTWYHSSSWTQILILWISS